MEITIDSKVKGLEEEISYREKKASARALELVEFKLVEIREWLNRLQELLHKKIERCCWRLRKKAKWPIRKLQERNLKYTLKVWVKNEDKLMETQYEIKVHYCELEQVSIIREEEYVIERPYESLMDCWENSYQHKEMMKTSTETREPYVLKANNWCMVAGFTSNEERKSLEIVICVEEDERRNNETKISHENEILFHSQQEVVKQQWRRHSNVLNIF